MSEQQIDITLDSFPKPNIIPDGKFAAPNAAENNFHRTINQDITINGQRRRVELIHQLRAGDCVLANFLNTCSVEYDGKLPMTITEARQSAIGMRREKGEDYSDIAQPDSALSYKDVVRLFSKIHGIPAQQEDILLVEGENRSFKQSQLDALNVLEYLDTYNSGLVTTGLGVHSRSIKRLDGGNYLLIDPMNSGGAEQMDTASLMNRLAGLINTRPSNQNFFLFIRK